MAKLYGARLRNGLFWQEKVVSGNSATFWGVAMAETGGDNVLFDGFWTLDTPLLDRSDDGFAECFCPTGRGTPL